eukprot:gb/GECH01010715.1/.p1 GENE.gb/GECH01010715.1/~~gb/GECH01010715.1/.p1  ORF type:complete len:211 (+),score=36.38 gb/GECH01010715.1/:1-633(+)
MNFQSDSDDEEESGFRDEIVQHESNGQGEADDINISEGETSSDDGCPFPPPFHNDTRPGYRPRRRTYQVCHDWEKTDLGQHHACSGRCESFFSCPTRYLHGHPEEKKRRKKEYKTYKSNFRKWRERGRELRKQKKKGRQNSRFRGDESIGPEVIRNSVRHLKDAIQSAPESQQGEESRSNLKDLEQELAEEKLKLEIAKIKKAKQKIAGE